MFLILLLACDKGAGTYEPDTWNSPLALEYEGEGDPVEGERLYNEEHWEDSSAYALSCQSCHANDPDDTLTTDAVDWTRAAHTTWNVAWRGLWKGSETWDVEESNIVGAYGGQICVTAYFPEGSAMTAEQAAHLEAWLRTRRDATEDTADPTSQPLDYGFNSWDTQDEFLASVADGAGWLYGAELGDTAAGEALALEYCGSCHIPEGESAPVFYSTGSLPLVTLIQRIRRFKLDDETPPPNDRMPRLPEDRLSDEDLRTLLAWLTAGREDE